MNKEEIFSVLKMDKMVFDRIHFDRVGFIQNDTELSISLNVQIGEIPDTKQSVVSLTVNGNKEREYSFSIKISGYFDIDTDTKLDKNIMLKQNAVAILMPYVRSQISLLTAQPETNCVVLPPINIANMIQE